MDYFLLGSPQIYFCYFRILLILHQHSSHHLTYHLQSLHSSYRPRSNVLYSCSSCAFLCSCLFASAWRLRQFISLLLVRLDSPGLSALALISYYPLLPVAASCFLQSRYFDTASYSVFCATFSLLPFRILRALRSAQAFCLFLLSFRR